MKGLEGLSEATALVQFGWSFFQDLLWDDYGSVSILAKMRRLRCADALSLDLDLQSRRLTVLEVFHWSFCWSGK